MGLINVTVRLDQDSLRWIDAMAAYYDRSRSQVIRGAVSDAVIKYGNDAAALLGRQAKVDSVTGQVLKR